MIPHIIKYTDDMPTWMAHEKMIRDADGWTKIKGEILSKFLTGGLWLAAGYLAFAVWTAFKQDVIK